MERPIDLIQDNVECLKQGREILDSVTDRQYASTDSILYKLGGIGRHVRHIIDFYSSFLRAEGGIIDYEQRERDPSIEAVVDRAKSRISEIIRMFETRAPSSLDPGAHVTVTASESSSYSDTSSIASTVGRELQFLISHTTHHYAIIAMILRDLGIEPPESFGVAPSTLRYLEAKRG